MSRTYRRTSGKRSWMKLEPEFEWKLGYQLVYGCTNYYQWWNSPRSWTTGERKIKQRFGYYYIQKSIWEPITLKRLDLKYKAEMERDRGNWTPSRTYKEACNTSDRSCRRRELHKIKESCYTGFDDIYEYDDSYENSTQRNLIWSIY